MGGLEQHPNTGQGSSKQRGRNKAQVDLPRLVVDLRGCIFSVL